MSHAHEHAHQHHHHDHAPSVRGVGRAFFVGIVLNVVFVVIESVFGVIAHSTALLADAAHNLSDVLGLAMAWIAMKLAERAPSNRLTYGLRRSTVLAALANSVLLVSAVGAVAWESIGRLRTPGEAHSATMIWVAASGVVVNGVSAWFFMKGRHSDANVRGAFIHLAADAAVSAGVVMAGLLLWKTGWQWLDPATSLLISAFVLYGTWELLKDALHLALDGVPKDVDLEAVRAYLLALPDVETVHDLHVWAMSTTEIALTAHLVLPWKECAPAFLPGLEHALFHQFGIHHATVQLEPSADNNCARSRVGAV
jgi:cobalt-zinc-cadmium efflux system protein